MAKEPRRFVRHADHAADLKGAHALLRRHHEMGCAQPLVQRYVAALVERAHGDGEGFTASVALVEAGARALALHERRLIDNAALGADRTLWPEPSFQPLTGFVGVVEDRVGKVAGHDGLLGRYSTPRCYYVK